MSGHSHWATIKHKKGAIDAKRGKLWSKLSRAIIIAARNGGGDPTMNLKLRYAIDKAREVSMPKDNIERAIKRGTGEIEGVDLRGDHLRRLRPRRRRHPGRRADRQPQPHQRRGPQDLRARRRQDGRARLRRLPVRAQGRLRSSMRPTTDEDTLMGIALDAGADDMKRDGANFEITCDPAGFGSVKEALEKQGVKFVSAEITQLPKVPQDVDVETGQKVMRLMEALDDHDDVQNVYSNLNLTEAMMASAE